MRALKCLLLVQGLLQVAGAAAAAAAAAEETTAAPDEEAPAPETAPQGSWWHWWSYDGISGPTYWNINKRWQICARGRQQSPVELRTELLVYDHLLGPFRFGWQPATGAGGARLEEESQPQKQSTPIRMQLWNSGRGLELTPLEGHANQEPLLWDGPLSYAYRLYRVEVHAVELAQGAPSSAGEHLINGRWFPGELQLHFYNQQLAGSAARALRLAERGQAPANLFAALAVFIKPVDSDAPPTALDLILEQVSQVANRGDRLQVNLTRAQLESLVPDTRHYITYLGSQNRPPCAEGLAWILVNQPLRVRAHNFRRLFEQTSTGQDNVRPVQPLNGRLLRTTIQAMQSGQAAAHCSPAAAAHNSTKWNCPQTPAGSGQQLLGCSMRPHYAYQLTGAS